MPPKKKKPGWISSQGRKLLDYEIRKKVVTRDMPLDQVYNMHRAEYEICGATPAEAYRLFEGRLKSAFERADVERNRSARELAAYKQDRQTHPRPATNSRGTPQWEGSVGQSLLKKDIGDGKHEGKTPTLFHQTRPEYQSWTVAEIAGHIKQEVKLRKWKENYPGRIKSIPPNHN